MKTETVFNLEIIKTEIERGKEQYNSPPLNLFYSVMPKDTAPTQRGCGTNPPANLSR